MADRAPRLLRHGGPVRMIGHTEGPWEVQACRSDQGASTMIATPGGDHLCTIPSPAWNPGAYLIYPQDRANAFLMAAAPDLLAALRRLEAACDARSAATPGVVYEVMAAHGLEPLLLALDEARRAARAAIAKAAPSAGGGA